MIIIIRRRRTLDNVYGAVIMTQVILRVHPVHLMNVEQRQVAVDHQTKPTDLGCESTCMLLLLPTFTIAIYYYSARKMIYSFYPPTEGRRLS